MNSFLSFQVHGNADGHDSLVTYLDALLAFLTGLLSKPPGEIFAGFFPGLAVMENLHPLLVHFPIAFFSSFFILDVLSGWLKKPHWRDLATGLLHLGTISAFFTVSAGFIAANSVAHGDNVHEIMERHELFGLIILCLGCLLSVWRWKFSASLNSELAIVHKIFAALLVLFVLLAADLGGFMVYQHGVAVQAVPAAVSQSYQEHSHHH